jgi:serine/threonine-protein kinase
MAAINLSEWPHISRLLDELLDADEGQQAQRLTQIGAREPGVAAQLQRLLGHRAAVETTQFLEGTALAAMDQRSLEGRTVGSYTLECLLGAGGMGGVWLARRSDGRYEGRAALKFLNLAWLGQSGQERFRREGVALARLSHPNIAQLIDAGTDRGQPYLVIEYVEGQPIDDWCDSRSLTVTERIDLFGEVLAAVVHAHERLILHRDLKPSNILVTTQGRVKLLDFGVAKLLDDPGAAAFVSGKAQQTARVFTPDYAAPEQVRSGEVTTATDVYTLGVLLHQLLVGEHPTARYDCPLERLQAVVEHEPLRMSEAVLRGSPHAAALRRSTPPRLARQLRGDLDNIVAKALRKEPGERYATAAAFADDVRRYLRHEPVEARGDSALYRVGKFIRRRRAVVAAVATALLLLIGGIVSTTWQAIEAKRQRDEAVWQADLAIAGGNLYQLILDEIGSSERPLTQRDLLARSEQLIEHQYADKPHVAALALMTVAGRYYNLGDVTRSGTLNRRVRELAAASGDAQLIAHAECNIATMHIVRGRIDLAEEQVRIALQALQRVARPQFGVVVECTRAEVGLAYAQGDLDRGLARADWARRYIEDSGNDNSSLYPSTFSYLSILQRDRGDLQASMVYAKHWQRLVEDRGGIGSVEYVGARRLEASILLLGGQSLDAGRIIDSIAAYWDSYPTVWLELERGSVLFHLDEWDEARDVLMQVMDKAEEKGHVDLTLSARYLLARVCAELGLLDDAERHLAAVEGAPHDNVKRRYNQITPGAVRTRILLARRLDVAAVQTITAELSRLGYPENAQVSPALGAALRIATRAHAEAGAVLKSMQLARAAVNVAERTALDSARSADLGEALMLLANAQQRAGDIAASRESAHRAAECLANGLGADHRRTLEARALAQS